MKVKELRRRLSNIDGECDVQVILNDYICKDIDVCYYNLEFGAFTIYVVDDTRGFLTD